MLWRRVEVTSMNENIGVKFMNHSMIDAILSNMYVRDAFLVIYWNSKVVRLPNLVKSNVATYGEPS